MNAKERSPDQEIEALKKLKRHLFLTVSAYWNQPAYRSLFNYALNVVGNAGFLDECMRFLDATERFMQDNPKDIDGYENFLKGYFEV